MPISRVRVVTPAPSAGHVKFHGTLVHVPELLLHNQQKFPVFYIEIPPGHICPMGMTSSLFTCIGDGADKQRNDQNLLRLANEDVQIVELEGPVGELNNRYRLYVWKNERPQLFEVQTSAELILKKQKNLLVDLERLQELANRIKDGHPNTKPNDSSHRNIDEAREALEKRKKELEQQEQMAEKWRLATDAQVQVSEKRVLELDARVQETEKRKRELDEQVQAGEKRTRELGAQIQAMEDMQKKLDKQTQDAEAKLAQIQSAISEKENAHQELPGSSRNRSQGNSRGY